MEATQRMESSPTREPDSDPEPLGGLLGRLWVTVDAEQDEEKPFDLERGSEPIKIGRDPNKCKICIDNVTLSRVHAVLEFDPTSSSGLLIYDNGSHNKTWRGKQELKKEVRYEVCDKQELTFGKVRARLEVFSNDSTEEEDEGMMATQAMDQDSLSEDHPAFVPETPVAPKRSAATPLPESPLSPSSLLSTSSSGNTPFRPGQAAATRVPETPGGELEASDLNDSSFLAPSQMPPPNRRPASSIMAPPASASVFDMETQEVSLGGEEGNNGSGIFSEETRAVLMSNDDMYEQDTQAVVLPPKETPTDVSEAPTQLAPPSSEEEEEEATQPFNVIPSAAPRAKSLLSMVEETPLAKESEAAKEESSKKDNGVEKEEEAQDARANNSEIEPEKEKERVEEEEVNSTDFDDDLFFMSTQDEQASKTDNGGEQKKEAEPEKPASNNDVSFESDVSEDLLAAAVEGEESFALEKRDAEEEEEPPKAPEESQEANKTYEEAETQRMEALEPEKEKEKPSAVVEEDAEEEVDNSEIATQLPDMDDGDDTDADSEIIGCSQTSTADRTNFVSLPMELTGILSKANSEVSSQKETTTATAASDEMDVDTTSMKSITRLSNSLPSQEVPTQVLSVEAEAGERKTVDIVESDAEEEEEETTKEEEEEETPQVARDVDASSPLELPSTQKIAEEMVANRQEMEIIQEEEEDAAGATASSPSKETVQEEEQALSSPAKKSRRSQNQNASPKRKTPPPVSPQNGAEDKEQKEAEPSSGRRSGRQRATPQKTNDSKASPAAAKKRPARQSAAAAEEETIEENEPVQAAKPSRRSKQEAAKEVVEPEAPASKRASGRKLKASLEPAVEPETGRATSRRSKAKAVENKEEKTTETHVEEETKEPDTPTVKITPPTKRKSKVAAEPMAEPDSSPAKGRAAARRSKVKPAEEEKQIAVPGSKTKANKRSSPRKSAAVKEAAEEVEEPEVKTSKRKTKATASAVVEEEVVKPQTSKRATKATASATVKEPAEEVEPKPEPNTSKRMTKASASAAVVPEVEAPVANGRASRRTKATTVETTVEEKMEEPESPVKAGRPSKRSKPEETVKPPTPAKKKATPVKKKETVKPPTPAKKRTSPAKALEKEKPEEIEKAPKKTGRQSKTVVKKEDPDEGPSRKSSRRTKKSTRISSEDFISGSQISGEEIKKEAAPAKAATKRKAAATVKAKAPAAPRAGGRRGAKKVVDETPVPEQEEEKSVEEESASPPPAKSSRRATRVKKEPVSPPKRAARETASSRTSFRGKSAENGIKKEKVEEPEEKKPKRGARAKAEQTSSPQSSTIGSKRKVKTEPVSPAAKRSRRSVGSSEVSSTTSSSRLRASSLHTVMFTGRDDPALKKSVAALGGAVTEELSDCTVLVSDKIRRTAKFLCMMGKGVPIVGPDWLKKSKSGKAFKDPWLHLIEDTESEKKWLFNLKNSLVAAKKGPLLSDYKVYATKSVKPPPEELKEIVEFAGGEWLDSLPKSSTDRLFIISCAEDKSQHDSASKATKIPIQDKEILLTGLLRRELAFNKHKL